MNERGDVEEYQKKLVRIFQSCDHGNKGYLIQAEFKYLCSQLHLQHHNEHLFGVICGISESSSAKVYFEDFKEALLSLLQEFGPEKLTTEQEQDQHATFNADVCSSEHGDLQRFPNHSHSSSDEEDICMKFPLGLTVNDLGLVLSVGKHPDHCQLSPSSPLKRSLLEDETDNHPGGKHRKSSEGEVETFEAEGQMEGSPDHRYDFNENSSMEHLIHICTKLGVGHHGYLTQLELGLVCQFIGMEQMEDEELEDLFARLDMDHDGYISFDEFVSGLSQYLTSPDFETPTMTPFSRPLHVKKRRPPPPPAHLNQNDLFIYTNGETITLFSLLESSNTGFAKGGEIVEFWESLHLHHGAEILRSMGFSSETKVNLKDLSEALICEWMGQLSSEDFLGHIISVTFQHELGYLRVVLDQTVEERNKLRGNLAEALTHNALLAAEVDERHAQLEKTYEAQLRSLDLEHHEQLHSLQIQHKEEKELRVSQAASLKQALENIQQLEQQVSSLHKQLLKSQQELAETCKELTQVKERQAEWEEEYLRLKKEMQLQQKQLTKLESPRSPSLEEEKQLAVEITNRLIAENKELKDRNDELMAQIEEMQRQILATSLRHGSSGLARRNSLASRIPVRTQTSSLSSDASEMDDDELLSSSEGFYFNRRSLLATPEESDSSPSLSSELKHLHRQRRGELRERERKEVEHAYRVEIADLEDKQREEKEQIIQVFEREKTRMAEDFQAVLNQRLAEQQKELQNIFALEKQDLLQQYESRKNYMELQHQQKIQQVLAGRAREEIQDKEKFPQNQMKEISDLHRHLSQKESIVQDLKKENADLVAKLLDVENRLSSCLNRELVWQKECQQKLQEQQSAFETKLHSELKTIFDQGESALKGKLKDDFHQLVQKRKDTLHEQQQPNTESVSASENSFDKEALYSAFEQEKVALESHYESKILNLEQELASLREASITEQNVAHSLQTGQQEVKMTATSTEMAAGERQVMQDAEEVKVQAARLRELESFSGLQVSLVESQRHASSPQQALVEHMQLSDRIMAEAEKQRQGERTAWEEEKREMQLQLRSTQDLHRNLVLENKQLCQSSTKLAEIAKDLYVRNVELTCELQQTERRLRAAQRQCRKLQETCQTWRNAVHRIFRTTGH